MPDFRTVESSELAPFKASGGLESSVKQCQDHMSFCVYKCGYFDFFQNGISPMESALPAEGIEPTHPCEYWILSPARLPVPPRRLCTEDKALAA